METIAESRAREMNGDGQCWTADDGRGADDVFGNGAKVRRNFDITVYEYRDGSAIVAAGGGWDVRAAGCTSACWAGVGCECAE